jgi:hypothetical protein
MMPADASTIRQEDRSLNKYFQLLYISWVDRVMTPTELKDHRIFANFRFWYGAKGLFSRPGAMMKNAKVTANIRMRIDNLSLWTSSPK